MSSGDANDGMEVDDPNVIRIKVENVKELDWFGVKAEKRIDGFPWKITVRRDEDDDIQVHVNCVKSRESRVWDCLMEGEIKLINHVDHSRSERLPIGKYFVFDTWSQCCKGFTGSIVDNEEFLTDGSIVVEVKIDVKGGNGDRFRKRAQIDFFSPSNYSDVILSVEGKKLHVSKQILANASPYFDARFFGNFNKSEGNEIVFDDVNFEDFLIVLEMIYDTGRTLDETNVEGVLMLADRFQVQNVINKAEEDLRIFRINSFLPYHLILLISDQYNFYERKAEVYTNCSFERLMSSDSYERYSEELKNEITEWRNNQVANKLEKIKSNMERYRTRNEERLARLKIKPDLLSPSRFSDVILLVGEEKIHASKQILAHASSYLENLFYGDPEKINEKEFVIEDVSFKEFLVALELIYDNRKHIKIQDVEFLLNIANQFNIESLTHRAELSLLYDHNTIVPLHKNLILAEQYKLDVLMKLSLKDFHRCREIVDLMESDSYSQYSSELKSELFEKMAELWKRENP